MAFLFEKMIVSIVIQIDDMKILFTNHELKLNPTSSLHKKIFLRSTICTNYYSLILSFNHKGGSIVHGVGNIGKDLGKIVNFLYSISGTSQLSIIVRHFKGMNGINHLLI